MDSHRIYHCFCHFPLNDIQSFYRRGSFARSDRKVSSCNCMSYLLNTTPLSLKMEEVTAHVICESQIASCVLNIYFLDSDFDNSLYLPTQCGSKTPLMEKASIEHDTCLFTKMIKDVARTFQNVVVSIITIVTITLSVTILAIAVAVSVARYIIRTLPKVKMLLSGSGKFGVERATKLASFH